VDFDLLVTDLAPVDLLLQRVGRLHRHLRDGRPGRLREPLCLVTGVTGWQEAPPQAVAGSRAVYGRFALLRSLAVLDLPADGGCRVVQLPHDISPLVQQAYGDGPAGPQAWAEAMGRARGEYDEVRAAKGQAADAFRIAEQARPGRSLVGWLAGNAGDADDTRAGQAQVRDAPESVEVIVVEELDDGSLATVSWAGEGRGGLALPTESVPVPQAARAAAACMLRLPARMAKPYVIDRVIAELEKFCIPSWQAKESIWLSGELILPVRAGCQTPVAGFRLSYSPDDGLEVSYDR
ncbi:CRISPR-associated helicase/endonuclease Cas3, partial [Streptomyces echinatus]